MRRSTLLSPQQLLRFFCKQEIIGSQFRKHDTELDIFTISNYKIKEFTKSRITIGSTTYFRHEGYPFLDTKDNSAIYLD